MRGSARRVLDEFKTTKKEKKHNDARCHYVSRRDLAVYVRRMSGESAKTVASRYGITSNNVDQIKYRMGIMLRKHCPGCFERALRVEARSSRLGLAA